MLRLLVVANFIMAAVFALRFSTLPPQIPLFYSRAWGEAQLADWWYLAILPILMNGLFVLNVYIQKRFFGDNTLVVRIFKYFTPFLIVVFTFIFIKVIFLVT